MAPKSGRELAAWLAASREQPLVRISGLPRSARGRPSMFTATIHSWNGSCLVVRPTDGTPPETVPMPVGWDRARDSPDRVMHFDDRGFVVNGLIHFTYLDEQDPFNPAPPPDAEVDDEPADVQGEPEETPANGRQLLGWAAQHPDAIPRIKSWGIAKRIKAKILDWTPDQVRQCYQHVRGTR